MNDNDMGDLLDLPKERAENKRIYTKEEVEELLKKQRKICADTYYNPHKDTLERWGIISTPDHLRKINTLFNAPSPLGEKK